MLSRSSAKYALLDVRPEAEYSICSIPGSNSECNTSTKHYDASLTSLRRPAICANYAHSGNGRIRIERHRRKRADLRDLQTRQ